MIPLLLAVALFDLPGSDADRLAACAALIKQDPAAAIAQATEWSARSIGVPARQCLGLAYVAAERWAPAATAFEAAAQAADGAADTHAAGLWSQAGNAQLAAGEPTRARTDLDRALRATALPPVLRGEAWLDRARADVALDDAKAARADLDQALALVPEDPFAWLLSATFARRQAELPRAAKDIAEANRLAGADPAVMLEHGNILWAQGQADAARAAWTRAAQTDPASPAGQAARHALQAAE